MNGHSPLFKVIGALEGVRKSGSGYEAHCPGPRHKHEDKHPSLSIGTGNDGRVLLDCKAGCETIEILSAIGLDWGDLFEKSQTGNPVRRYRLLNGTGQVVAEHVREDRSPGDKIIRWERDGKNGLAGLKTEDLPLYRGLDVTARPGDPVIVTEGEKAAEALAGLGLLAVGTVTGADHTPSEGALAVLQGREVWLWPDNDDIGRKHMERIAGKLQPSPRWVDWAAAPPKGDAADYVEGGGKAAGVVLLLRQVVPLPSGPRIWTGPQLAAMAFDSPRWAIPNLLPAGLAILAGRPKLGKSWLALGWSLDIPRPSPALRKMKVVQGETLYLALEDGPRRMQERMTLMLGDASPPVGFNVVTEWPRTNEGGLDLLDQWLQAHPTARLIVIDTFKRVRPQERGNARLYDLDYDAISPLAELARHHNVAIVLVFHTRKMVSDDPLEMVSGTLGVSGAADAVLVLRRERGQADASLFVTGRDVEEQDLALKWETEDTLGWTLLGQAEDFRRSRERQVILDTIKEMPGMTPSEIADVVDKSRGSVRKLLFSMVRDGEVRVREQRYHPQMDQMSTRSNGNSGNSSSQTVTAALPSIDRAVTGTVPTNTSATNIPVVSAVTDHAQKPLCPVHHKPWDNHDCEAL